MHENGPEEGHKSQQPHSSCIMHHGPNLNGTNDEFRMIRSCGIKIVAKRRERDLAPHHAMPTEIPIFPPFFHMYFFVISQSSNEPNNEPLQ
jgi:hypothetical protein